MAAGVAHDFNNVLATIMVRAELLRQVLPDPRWISHVEVIERVAHDGSRTVRRLQEFTRPAKTVDFRPVDLNGAVRDSLEITKSRWKDDAHLSGVHIEVQTDLGDIPNVLGDASEIREVLTNLIVNAVDAMPRGGCLRLATRTLPEGDRVELTVADTGIGMTDEIRAQIFDPFFTTKGPGGSGLGLSVSYGILKRHTGTIRVQTAPEAGTTFVVTLPAVEGEPEAEPEAAAAVPDPLRILVIDDEEGLRVSLYTALHREGHFVAVAGSGEEGLRLFGISRFDVVITDLGMPGMSGWQVAQVVKRLRPRTPVILITGWGATLSEADRQRPEVDAILAKPVTAKAILQALGRLNAGRHGAPARRGPEPGRGERRSA
jgi:CheY-like chemotaxis protein/anti-sigma regulatory factor (Ser/Thr protein kinase)